MKPQQHLQRAAALHSGCHAPLHSGGSSGRPQAGQAFVQLPGDVCRFWGQSMGTLMRSHA